MYTYHYPRPAVSVDIILIQNQPVSPQILLIQRKSEPFQDMFALPGGFVGIDEPLKTAALRELKEETGLEGIPLQQIYAFGAPHRDPRGRVISIAYGTLIEHNQSLHPRPASDASSLGWFDLNHLPPLAFDHAQIIRKGAAVLQPSA
ncbi:MAG: NUDIX hydrolase [Anaerolineales bacterium]|nr:NUDIX hydrolase [Anaerolineales bacterium]